MQQTIQTARNPGHALANSLRRDAAFTEAANSRPGEISNRFFHELSLRRDAVLPETANSRPGETRDSGGFTGSRSSEAFSPERDYASLKTKKGRLGEFSWQ